MKARSGVTLVELLVVILIVTILSVSMLPLLQPFVVEAQYAAEPIPVIGNIRTKVGLYQYDKGKLPCDGTEELDDKGKPTGKISEPVVETWFAVATKDGTEESGAENSDYFKAATFSLPSGDTAPNKTLYADDPTATARHFGYLTDIDWQELKGKRSKPSHYQYLVMYNGTQYAYFLGCFGDGNGLKKGTGYAVCEIVTKDHKYVGTWRRYKAIPPEDDDAQEQQLYFCNDPAVPEDGNTRHAYGCYIPSADQFPAMGTETDGVPAEIATMKQYGWEF